MRERREALIPATDERRRRRLGLVPVSPIPAQSRLAALQRPRDYSAIYAWSPELPVASSASPAASAAAATMKRSATFGDDWNRLRSDANGYVEPARHRADTNTNVTVIENIV